MIYNGIISERKIQEDMETYKGYLKMMDTIHIHSSGSLLRAERVKTFKEMFGYEIVREDPSEKELSLKESEAKGLVDILVFSSPTLQRVRDRILELFPGINRNKRESGYYRVTMGRIIQKTQMAKWDKDRQEWYLFGTTMTYKDKDFEYINEDPIL